MSRKVPKCPLELTDFYTSKYREKNSLKNTASYRGILELSVTRVVVLYFVSLGTEHVVAQLVEALRYKPRGRGFDCR
jgi:hypothetical protein